METKKKKRSKTYTTSTVQKSPKSTSTASITDASNVFAPPLALVDKAEAGTDKGAKTG
jgi:hypothetical protein